MIKAKSSFVIDTSVVIKWFLKEPFEKEALQIRDAFRSGQCTLSAPDLIYPEFANTIWKRVSFNNLDPDEGALMVVNFRLIPLEVIASKNLLPKALSLGLQHKRPVYDALFLSLSLANKCPFITADEKLYNAVHSNLPDIIWIGDWNSK